MSETALMNENDANTGIAAAAKRNGQAAERRYRILMVDDDPELLRCFQSALEHAGFEFLSAQDGLTALDLCRKRRPHAVIVDLNFRNGAVPGTEVVRTIKEDPQLASIVVFVFTGSMGKKLEEMLMDDFGADEYFLKGETSMESLIRRLRSWLRRLKIHNSKKEFKLGALLINYAQVTAYGNDKLLALTPKEYNLLVYLARKSPGVASWDKLAKKFFNVEMDKVYAKALPALEVHINHLRGKLKAAGVYLITERNSGLRLAMKPG